MKNILTLIFLFYCSTYIFAQDNEDRQGDSFSNDHSISDLNTLLKYSYSYEHKSLTFKNDSLIQVNKHGKRSIRVRDIDISSFKIIKDDGSKYKVIIKCNTGDKCMIADWGTYDSFSMVVNSKPYAEDVITELKRFLYSLGYN